MNHTGLIDRYQVFRLKICRQDALIYCQLVVLCDLTLRSILDFFEYNDHLHFLFWISFW